jgi:hypothetical protein
MEQRAPAAQITRKLHFSQFSYLYGNTGQKISQQPVVRIPASAIEQLLNRKFEVNVFPNPSTSHFELVIHGDNKNPVTIKSNRCVRKGS